jgi:uncharacterized membrane protein
MSQHEMTETPASRLPLISTTVFMAAALIGLIYYVQSYDTAAWQGYAWMVTFAVLILVRSFLQTRGQAATREVRRDKPGVYAVDTILYILILIFLSSATKYSFDEVLAGFWPLIAGYILGSLVSLLYRISALKHS